MQAGADRTRGPRWWNRLLAAFVVLIALGLRAVNVPRHSLWVDEAESSINALTILKHGYPTDHYLGIPIYENCLILPWPESEEYEFRDISYSEGGCAIYHGWFPLYCMAASLAICGIEPDQHTNEFAVRHTSEEWAWRTIAPRIPSILFSLAFLFLLSALANQMYGPPAAWAALVGASLADTLIWFGWQARYYSAALALSTATALALWNLGRHGRWRDFVSAAILLVLLFHTHLLGFVSCWVLLLFLARSLARQRRARWKFAALTGIVVAGTLPWVVATRFLANAFAIPKAWPLLLEAPKDLWLPLTDSPGIVLLNGIGVAVFLGARVCRRLRGRLASWFAGRESAFAFALVWLAGSWLSFVLLIPAVSYWKERIVLATAVPAVLFGAMFLGAVCDALARRHSSILACLGVVLVVGGLPSSLLEVPQTDVAHRHWDLLDAMREWDVEPGTRIYATPNDHLILTYYGGAPIQSIAPVRRSFLDAYPGRIIVVECSPYWPLPVNKIVEAGTESGLTLTTEVAWEWRKRVIVYANACHVASRGARVRRPASSMGEFGSRLVDLQRELTRDRLSRLRHLPLFRGFPLETSMDKWRVFQYRFTDPPQGNQRPLNYANRLQRATARITPSWVILDSKAP